MNDKEFEEFFKSLENNDNSGSAKDDYAGDEFVFSGFFEDNTTADKNKTEKPSERRAAFDFSDDDDFAPPPPEEDEDEASFAPPPSIDDEDEPQPIRTASENITFIISSQLIPSTFTFIPTAFSCSAAAMPTA